MPPAEPPRPAGPTRAIPRGLAFAAVALAAARLIAALWGAEPAPASRPEKVSWIPIEQAEARARAASKPILYDFTADWCPPCQAMKRDLFADEAAARTIERLVVPVRVLDRQRETGRNLPAVDSLQRAYGVEAFPTLVVAWPGSSSHATSRGYRGRDLTLRWLAASVVAVQARASEAAPTVP